MKKSEAGNVPSGQIQRFRQAARDLGCDENEDRFKDALRKIAEAPPAKQESKSGRAKRRPTGG